MGLWGKTDSDDQLIIESYDFYSGKWTYVQDVGVNGAARVCRGLAKKTKVKHRVWNTTTNTLFCECA